MIKCNRKGRGGNLNFFLFLFTIEEKFDIGKIGNVF